MPRPKSTAPTCSNGHPRTPENREVIERCKRCVYDRVAEYRARQADKARRPVSKPAPDRDQSSPSTI